MIKICISGALGRMGKNIIDVVKEDPEVEIKGLLEKKGTFQKGDKINGIEITDDVEKATELCDCFIDFTNPEATVEHLKKIKIPAVVGTTGFDESEINEIKKISKKIPVVLSPNMSRGVNLLFSIVRAVSEKLYDYDIEIVEAHHNKKKDAPSGTAKKIADIINDIRHLKKTYGREGFTGERKKDELGIHAIRAGEIVGEHEVIFAGKGEIFKISHTALSRKCFAEGAVFAAKWVCGKKPALYSMGDVLGI